jgi:uncharacterized membrane protein
MKKNLSKRLAVVGMTAAAYFVLTFFLQALAFREVQFRVSEILNLLAFVNPIFGPGVVLGCFLSNLVMSPLGVIDIVLGTLATALAVLCITHTKKLWAAAVWPVLFCFIIVFELIYVFEMPRDLLTFATVSASVLGGEAVVMFGLGYPLFRFLMKNEKIMKLLKEV